MTIEQQMDEARVPVEAQNGTLTEYDQSLRDYVVNVRDEEPGGINFVIANVCNADLSLTASDARLMVWVMAKELILSNRRVMVMNASKLASWLTKTDAWEDDTFRPDFADHLVLNNFFREGQESPYTAAELNKLIEYIGDRYDYGKTTHCVWDVNNADGIGRALRAWYPQLWSDWWFDENTTYQIKRTRR